MDPALAAQLYPPEYLAEDRSRQLTNTAIAFAVLATVFVGLFFTSRVINKTVNGPDFWLMPPAYIACLGQVTISFLYVRYGGAGRHVQAVSPETIVAFLKLQLVTGSINGLAILLPKLCILTLYLRAFSTRIYRRLTYLIGVAVILLVITSELITLTGCRPFAYNWDKTIKGGHSPDNLAIYRWISVPNIATDVAMLILPLSIIWRLHLGRAQKVGLTITFLTGSVGMITAIIRMVFFFTTDFFSDPTYIAATIMAWTMIEPGVYLIAACLPSLRPISGKVFQNVAFSTAYSRLVGYSSRTFSTRQKMGDIPLAGQASFENWVDTGSHPASITKGIRIEDTVRVQREGESV